MNTLEYDALKGRAKELYKLLCDNGYDVNYMCGMRVSWEKDSDVVDVIKLLNDNGYVNFNIDGHFHCFKGREIDSTDKYITICFLEEEQKDQLVSNCCDAPIKVMGHGARKPAFYLCTKCHEKCKIRESK